MRNYKIEYRCLLPHGLHARPATQLEAVCQRFSATIEWCNRRNGRCANAKSVLALLSTDTLFRDVCDIVVSGHDAQRAANSLRHFLRYELNEQDDSAVGQNSFVVPRNLRASHSLIFPGLVANAGFARGQLVLFDSPEPSLPVDLPLEKTEEQQRLLQSALTQLQQQLSAQYRQASTQTAQILQAHLSLLSDITFQQKLSALLTDSPTLAHAILQLQRDYQTQFMASDSPYLQERELDLRDLCQQLLVLIYPTWAKAKTLQLHTASVVLADELTPSQFLSLERPHLRALLLTKAARTSHAVILARAAGIPVLTGMYDSRLTLAAGQMVWVDANAGFCLLQPDAVAERYYALDEQIKLKRLQQLQMRSQTPGVSADGQRLEIAANIASASDTLLAFQSGAEGIGLFRTEMLFMDREQPPDEEEQYQAYVAVLTAAAGKPVIIRTFDIGGDKPVTYLPAIAETNPYLGLRGIRLYPYQETLFRTQLRALLRAAVHGPLKVMLPMVLQPEEVIWARQLMAEEQAVLQSAHIPHAQFLLGIMLEIPAAALQISAFCPLVDFFSIGSNDLTQYLLAVDRNNPQVARYYQTAHPALWILLRQMVLQAHQHGRWIGLCGELASDRRFLPLLLGLGLDELSLATPQIAETKALLSQLNAGQCRELLAEVCACANSEQVLASLNTGSVAAVRSMLSEECMTLQADWRNKAEVLKGMVDTLWLAGRTQQSLQLEETLWQREEAYSTGLGHGIAIPHAKTDVIEHSAISIARLAHPVDWGSLDGQPVDLVIMLTLNAQQGADEHLRIFSRLARRMMYDEFRQQLRQAPNAAALCALLQQELEM
ncbi:phosphoenolpyruvate--protein phosphotransferase [uncultured Tolumonas sp.]|uniref:phosphoenolpyruvate--protein phosphotransferase n=1 Tax=uncultured Tolumonas sp. TaxID=263765 RepID=UPI002A0A4F33|nr:phosphoenolpyruvate--protein phosphotransferase [uncultured Tolumonas sp.]